jgi:hypothetical protein
VAARWQSSRSDAGGSTAPSPSTIAGCRCAFEGWWCPKLKLEEHGELRACASQSGALRRGFHFAFGDDEYELYPTGVFSRSFELSRKKRPLGRIGARGAFSRRASIDLDDELPLEVRLFALWLVLLAWRRAAAGAAAGGGAAAAAT